MGEFIAAFLAGLGRLTADKAAAGLRRAGEAWRRSKERSQEAERIATKLARQKDESARQAQQLAREEARFRRFFRLSMVAMAAFAVLMHLAGRWEWTTSEAGCRLGVTGEVTRTMLAWDRNPPASGWIFSPVMGPPTAHVAAGTTVQACATVTRAYESGMRSWVFLRTAEGGAYWVEHRGDGQDAVQTIVK
ncbi:MAG: hypothetical protein OXG35_07750 [Acidobacteria bacterium]|nr:hypothetical protein [Acidobacteriota bacterium]